MGWGEGPKQRHTSSYCLPIQVPTCADREGSQSPPAQGLVDSMGQLNGSTCLALEDQTNLCRRS